MPEDYDTCSDDLPPQILMQLSHVIAIGFCVVTVGGAMVALMLSRRRMTDTDRWRKKKTILVHAKTEPEMVAKVVRWKLTDPRFTETVEKVKGREFHAWFRRDQQTLAVRIQVNVTPSTDGTALSVRCFPEWFTNSATIAIYHAEMETFAASACSTTVLTDS